MIRLVILILAIIRASGGNYEGAYHALLWFVVWTILASMVE